MLGRHFYNESIRKIIIGFGTLFNNIELRRRDSNNTVIQTMKVPLAYGPREKFLARVNAEPDLEDRKSTQIQLPRISFELTTLKYDPSRKLVSTQICQSTRNTGEVFSQYVPVPYNFDFDVSIIAKHNDDAVQIIEQILPFFQPSFTITINMISNTNEYKDIPIILNDIDIRDEYEADFTVRRTIIYSLQFTAKGFIYGPLTTSKIIKKVNSDIGRILADGSRIKDSRYTVTPKALVDYNEDGTIIDNTNINLSDSQITLTNHNFITGSKVMYRTIGNSSEPIEPLESNGIYYVIKLDPSNFRLAETKLKARNGIYIPFDSAGSGEHKFSIINQYDDTFVEPDDDFGFNELWTDYPVEDENE